MNSSTELTDTELDAVCGGLLNFGNIVAQSNGATNSNLNVFGVQLGSTVQAIAQGNASVIG